VKKLIFVLQASWGKKFLIFKLLPKQAEEKKAKKNCNINLQRVHIHSFEL